MSSPPNPFREVEIPEGQGYPTAQATQIFRPHVGIDEFWPASEPEQHEWLAQHEIQHIVGLGNRIAALFGVPLISDADYNAATEEERATALFCVMTRNGIDQTKPGVFTWNPICVVVRYCIVVSVRCQLDATNSKCWILDAKIWADKLRSYEFVFDEKTGWIRNPNTLIQILSMYASMEGLAP